MRRVRYFAVIAAALVAGCGGGDTTDLERVQDDLARHVEETTGTKGADVACPEDVQEGDLCDVTAPGGVRARVRVTRLDDDRVEGEIVEP